MPELPEVQTVVNTLMPHLVGRTIKRVVHLRGDIVEPAGFDLVTHLHGRRVESIHRRAKRIVISLDDLNQLYIHLGMTGRLTIEPPDRAREIHTHLVLDIGERELRFRDPRRFGGIFWLGREACDADLGPEPLTLRARQLTECLSATTRAIKNALLDQTVIAGLGNIYVDESLFAARIHPLTPADKLTSDQIARLNQSIKSVLRRALKHRGSTLRDYVDAEGGKGAFQRLHKVYDREGDPCSACRRPITRIVLGGRSTCFCVKCQPLKRARRRS
jgi:formamidopyrimidine-DNA glycosylase